ncbi:MAG: hypothetical protein CG443_467, partial [Methanosaeta sp. ASP1-1]
KVGVFVTLRAFNGIEKSMPICDPFLIDNN